jgi:hypothetical protein
VNQVSPKGSTYMGDRLKCESSESQGKHVVVPRNEQQTVTPDQR